MKLQVNRTEIDKLTFHWDHKASRSSSAKRSIHTDYNKKRTFEGYFDLLDEIKPNIGELRHTRMFEKPFTLGSME